MLFITIFVALVVPLIIPAAGWQPASFDLNDPSAARAKVGQLYAIEDLGEQGRAWCALSPPELRAIARHSSMSNTITTTTRTDRHGETLAESVIVEPAPNQAELIAAAVQLVTDSCRYDAWSVAQAMQAVADESAAVEILCRRPRESQSSYLQAFLLSAASTYHTTTTTADGTTITTTTDYPPEPVAQAGLAEMLDGIAAACPADSPAP